ncbi:MAG: Rrf2 family transcriptional regulator [Pseudomonadota bacterium]|nr:Rrf2 family transcriptional regulator [Pseudomonadota bacterium]MEE3098251.1 Rrf2 family transcriptional regulator [Pseudomonadota bacterium]
MRLSRFSDYALRACLYLGAHEGRLAPISEIARAHDLSQSNLMKVVNLLVEGGILRSVRGRNGGVALARPATGIRIGEIVRLMEGDGRMVDCSACLLRGNCGLVGALRQAKLAFYASLDAASLADALRAHPRTLDLLLGAGPDAAAREGAGA